MDTYVRGMTIYFSATCTDDAGAPATPNSAKLHLVYANLSGVRTNQEVVMTINDSVVTAEWDSSVAQPSPATVRWSIRATGARNVVEDGEFALSANEANSTD